MALMDGNILSGVLWGTVALYTISPAVADDYPVRGAWVYVSSGDSPGNQRKACEAYNRLGLSKLTGDAIGGSEIIVFNSAKRYNFGGYADDITPNISVRRLSDNSFDVVDRWYSDGEGGGRPGPRKRRYVLKIVDSNKIEIKEGRYPSAKYLKCAQNDSPSPNADAHRTSSNLPQKVGQCVETAIRKISDRFGKPVSPLPSKDGFDPGTLVVFENGGSQISYDKETSVLRSKIGDKVRMCLVEIPKDCPPGDDRGRVYNTKNLRTGEAWTLSDSQHRCGGA
jgi:hypothetical protein